jgi:hypothetical protein
VCVAGFDGDERHKNERISEVSSSSVLEKITGRLLIISSSSI